MSPSGCDCRPGLAENHYLSQTVPSVSGRNEVLSMLHTGNLLERGCGEQIRPEIPRVRAPQLRGRGAAPIGLEDRGGWATAIYLTAYGATMKKMDYTIGFQAGHEGQRWTATALTDQAKARTPKAVTFAGRPEALNFLKDSQAEGYRFSGAELVDPEQRLVKNRYFVIGGDGQLTFSGEDNGPRNTVWEIGDVKPGRDSSMRTEAVIENILQGPGVRERFGCDLAFVLRLHPVARGTLAMELIPPFDPAKPCPCGLHGKPYGDCCKAKGIHALGNEMLRGTAPRMVAGGSFSNSVQHRQG